MGDEVEDVETADALGFEEVGGVGIFFFQNRRQQIAEPDVLLARRVHVHHGPLQDPLQADGLLGDEIVADGNRLQLLVEKFLENASQPLDIPAAADQHLLPPVLKEDGVEHMLGRQIFVATALGFPYRQGKSDLYILIEHA